MMETSGVSKEGLFADWSIRMRIAIGVARGLAYLHHGCNPRIIHGDISASNILLDKEFEPYLTDFGLAKLVGIYNTHVTGTVGGSFGYIAPGIPSFIRVVYETYERSSCLQDLECMDNHQHLKS